MIQRLAEPAPDEVRPERLEDVLEGPRPRPLADRVAHVHAAGEHVRHDDVVCIGPVIHEVDHDVALGDSLERELILVIDAGLVEEIDDDLRNVVPDLVVREHVEVRNDFVEVFSDLTPHRRLRHTMLGHVRVDRDGDRGIVGEPSARQTRLLQLIAA